MTIINQQMVAMIPIQENIPNEELREIANTESFNYMVPSTGQKFRCY